MRRTGSPAAVVALVVVALVVAVWTASAANADDPPEPVTRATLPLRFDDRGALVATAQERLLWLGYPLSENSQDKDLFGITMRRAVKAFQAKHWLPVSGRIDQRTWRTLRKLGEPVDALPRRCTEVPKAICIDKSTRLLRYVVKGTVRMTADARFGGPGMETGEGVFRVNSKSYNHVSSLYGSWMPRAMFFNGDEAVHYSPDFASVGYSRGSHGCVGMRDMEKATWLFGQVPVGTRVYVYWS
jgi:lipoprotein-anchoring transpeptidase ErfK/SrfK